MKPALFLGAGLAGIMLLAGLSTAVAQAPLYTLTKTIPLGGGPKWDYLHFDPATNRVYISHGTELDVIDATTGTLAGRVTGLDGSHGVAIDAKANLGFADSARNRSITVFNLASLAPIKKIPALLDADGMVYDAASGQVYIVGGDANAVLVVNAKTQKPVTTIPLGGAPEFLVTDNAGSLYVNINDKNQIVRIRYLEKPDHRALAGRTLRQPHRPCDRPGDAPAVRILP